MNDPETGLPFTVHSPHLTISCQRDLRTDYWTSTDPDGSLLQYFPGGPFVAIQALGYWKREMSLLFFKRPSLYPANRSSLAVALCDQPSCHKFYSLPNCNENYFSCGRNYLLTCPRADLVPPNGLLGLWDNINIYFLVVYTFQPPRIVISPCFLSNLFVTYNKGPTLLPQIFLLLLMSEPTFVTETFHAMTFVRTVIFCAWNFPLQNKCSTDCFR